MRHRRFITAITLAIAPALSVNGGGIPGMSERLDDQLTVRLLAGASVGDFIAAFTGDHAGVTLAELDAIPSRSIHLLEMTVPKGTDLDLLEQDLNLNYLGLLLWGEFSYENEAPEGHTGSTFVDSPVAAGLYADQYLTGVLGLDAAHLRSTGTATVVAVLDTGVDATHPLLQDRVLPGGFNFVDDNTNIDDVGDGNDTDGDLAIDELVGHGTFVAGLIALVAPDARILPVRILDGDGGGSAWILAEGLYYAIDHGVEVINLSLGSTYDADIVEEAIHEAQMLGIPVVAAAGNLNRSEPEEFPAMTSDAFGVAATDDLDVKADFSNFDDKILISAPGAWMPDPVDPGQPDPLRSIVSTVPNGGFAFWAGTSTAVPLVSGAVALVRSQHPEWEAGLIAFDAQKLVLTTTAINIDAMNPDYVGLLGAGRLDLAAATADGPVAPALGDLDGDGAIDVDDLTRVILDWGQVHTPADLNGDGTVDVDDLVYVITNWG